MRRRRRRGVRVTIRRQAERLRKKPILIGLAGVVALGLLVLAWCGWTAYQVYDDLRDAKNQALVVEAALARGDVDAARRANASFQDSTRAAAERTDGAAWGVFEALPIVGDDAAALTTVSDVLSEVGDEGIPPLLDSAAELTAGAYAPTDHQFPLDRIAALERPAARSHAVFEEAGRRLHDLDGASYVGFLRRELDALTDEVERATSTLSTAERASRLMPTMLGANGPRDYLLVFQNNAELRALGGLPGIVSLVHAENGRVDIVRQESGNGFQPLERPVLPLEGAERALYGNQLGTYFLDANFTPDLPRAAALWRARWERETDSEIDGVLLVDPVAVSYLMGTTGTMQVEGRVLTAENIVTEIEHLAYLRYADQVSQDGFFKEVASTTFDVFADGGGDPVDLVRGLARGVAEQRIKLHFFAPETQAVIEGTAVAGEVSEEPSESPEVGVYLNDGTGAKLSFFLDHEVAVTSSECANGRQRLAGTLRLTSDTPELVASLPETVIGYSARMGRLDPGEQLVVADLFGPVGGAIGDLSFDGKELENPAIDHYLARDVISIGVPLQPGETTVVTWTMTTGAGQTGPTQVSVTPGARPENESSVVPTTC